VTTAGSSLGSADVRGAGWLMYATVMLGLVGTFNVIDGVVALSKSSFYVAGARFIFSDLRTWGWIVLIVGALEIIAALNIVKGSELARWFGIATAALNAFAQLGFINAYPVWTIAAFTMDMLVIYALAVYGGAKIKRAQA